MPSRKQLKNLACGIASRFASRNNDIDGYWALGLLYAAADAAATNVVRVDLVSETSIPSFKHSAKLISQFNLYLWDQLAKLDLTGCVDSATIEVKFNVEPLPIDSMRKTTWGDLFSCCVKITDDFGLVRTGAVRGWCHQHDAQREHRSTRAYAS